MWVKDPDSGQMVFYKDLEANQFVMPQSGYHMRMPPEVRLKSMFDDGAYETIAMPQVPADPLKFRDERKYADRIKEARSKTDADDCIQAGHRHARRLAGHRGRAGLRLHGWLAGHGGR